MKSKLLPFFALALGIATAGAKVITLDALSNTDWRPVEAALDRNAQVHHCSWEDYCPNQGYSGSRDID